MLASTEVLCKIDLIVTSAIKTQSVIHHDSKSGLQVRTLASKRCVHKYAEQRVKAKRRGCISICETLNETLGQSNTPISLSSKGTPDTARSSWPF